MCYLGSLVSYLGQGAMIMLIYRMWLCGSVLPDLDCGVPTCEAAAPCHIPILTGVEVGV